MQVPTTVEVRGSLSKSFSLVFAASSTISKLDCSRRSLLLVWELIMLSTISFEVGLVSDSVM